MNSFQLLFDRHVPHILQEIFEEVGQPSLEECRLVCRQWNNFIKTTMVATEGDLQKRRDCHVWTEAAWTARREAAALPLAKNWRWLRGGGGVHTYLAKGEGVIERFSVGGEGEGEKLTCTGTMLLPSGPGFCPNGPLGILRYENALEFTENYIFVVTDGFDIPVFDKETLEQVGIIDMELTEDQRPRDDDTEGDYMSRRPPPRSSHICTLRVVDGQVYVVALQAGRRARLTLYKLNEDLGLSAVCDLPFDEWSVAYKNHEPILQRMPPLIFAVNSTHVLYTGRLVRTRPVVFNHRDRAEVQVLKSPECRADNNDRTNSKSDGHWSHLATPGHTWHLGGGGGGGEGVVFDIRLHISEDFYALAVDGELQLFALADHERLFEDAFAASTPPTFGRSVVAYMSVRDGGCDLSCTVVRYSEGVFSKLLSVEGLSSRTTADLTGASEQYLLLQNGLDVLRVWDLQKGDQEGRRLSKKGDKMVGRHLPFTSCVLIGTRTILVEAWSNEWVDKELSMCLRADIEVERG